VPGATDTAILDINSTITLPSSTSVGTFIHLNTTFVGSNATLTIPTGSTLTILNDFQWNQGGTENGAGSLIIAAGATWHQGTSGTGTLSQRTVNIQGTAIFPNNGFGTISMANGATINNSGTMDFQGSSFSPARARSIILRARPSKTRRAITPSSSAAAVQESPSRTAGTVRAEMGTLGFNGGYVQTAGSSQMAGGILNLSGFMQLQGGELAGVGAFGAASTTLVASCDPVVRG
jgi:hypothetical protein